MSSKEIGILGEKIARDYLKKKGYQILDKNYSFRFSGSPQKGEIDIIAQKGDIVSFMEVKTSRDRVSRTYTGAWEPEEKVNFEKKKRLLRAAESWLMKEGLPLSSKWQIDVVSVKINLATKKAKIRHFRNINLY